MSTYRECKNCGNNEDGEWILRCEDCHYHFCYNCAIHKSGFPEGKFHCPKCDCKYNTKIGVIENDSDRYSSSPEPEYEYSPPERTYFDKIRRKEAINKNVKEAFLFIIGGGVFGVVAFFANSLWFILGVLIFLLGLYLLFVSTIKTDR